MSHSHFNYLKDGKVETIANEDLDTTDYCTAWVKPESCLQNWVGSKIETTGQVSTGTNIFVKLDE